MVVPENLPLQKYYRKNWSLPANLGEGSIDFERFFSLIKNMQPDFPITIEISPRHISGKINSLNIDEALDNLYKTFWKFID